jgi:pimeloyl-ACP methyl ester carboxylesterase
VNRDSSVVFEEAANITFVPTASPKLVLLPGMDGTGELLDSFVRALPRSFTTQIVRYPPNRYLASTELFHLLDSTVFGSGPFVLIAESFSSPLAFQWAATNPANLKGLIICAGFTTSPIRGALRSIFRLLSPFCFLVTPPASAIKLLLVGRDASPSLVAAVRSAISSVRPEVLSCRLRMVLTCDARSELNKVAVPMLFIQPKNDRLIGLDRLEEMKQIKPGVEIEIVAGPHLLLLREPEMAAEVVARFVRQC